MRFEFYNPSLDQTPKLSVDGTVSNSIHFSHWEGNLTPAEVKADTSTEIALNVVSSPNMSDLTQGIELVTNNHFDTDGVLSVWTILNGNRALKFRALLIAAAESGDFSEYSSKEGICISLAIQGCEQASPNDDTGSPLARLLAGEAVADDARAYELVLPNVEQLLIDPGKYESLWGESWKKIEDAVRSFELEESRVTEMIDVQLSVVTVAPRIFGDSGFNPKHHASPSTAISKYAKGQVFLIAIPADDSGWFYRVDYPYYSWAETVVRPRILPRDFSMAISELQSKESSERGSWRLDNREMTSIFKFVDEEGALAPSRLTPETIVASMMPSLAKETKLSASGL